jgi:hypothetical protein
MGVAERRELMRAGKVTGVSDEISFLRMRVKQAKLENAEDLEVLSLSLERLSRMVAAEERMSGRKSPDAAERLIASLQAFEDQIGPIPESKFGGPIIRPADDEGEDDEA